MAMVAGQTPVLGICNMHQWSKSPTVRGSAPVGRAATPARKRPLDLRKRPRSSSQRRILSTSASLSFSDRSLLQRLDRLSHLQ
ncbi:hypothetical protein GUJ93_ZPchr0008g11944 [Zizania palustris]|uniref:Uncharacterized protein n=1 Tax=Zizania palustris TaxID=103762 RepID=A0A8J5RUT0_ZIZPA|nr:hypothetical protein GUJ93_ZPchr0008g11944 [Zizania palustris]